MKLFEQAAQRGDKEAEKFALVVKAGIAHIKKETLAPDVLAQLKERARTDVELMLVLYKVYMSGIGGYAASSPEAIAEGMKWLRSAVAAGNAEALKVLGVHYHHGSGIPMDKQEALKLFEQAAQRGDKDAEGYASALKAQLKEALESNN
ncbi:MAG: hypothetical protein NEHIOOID_01313 [Holosporales bacterium]